MISIVTFKWNTPGYRTTFTAEHVNAVYRAVQKHYTQPHRFCCITDDPTGLHPDIVYIPIWKDLADVPPPNGIKSPNCYRRLKLFSPEARAIVGDRFVTIDLDCIIIGDLTPLFERTEKFVIWGGDDWINGSLMMMDAGAHPEVWDRFDPNLTPREFKRLAKKGSDQGWILHVLGCTTAKWTANDGVYNYRDLWKRFDAQLPANARIVFFNGKVKAWDEIATSKSPWIKKHAC